jgi:hypothetical protein
MEGLADSVDIAPRGRATTAADADAATDDEQRQLNKVRGVSSLE